MAANFCHRCLRRDTPCTSQSGRPPTVVGGNAHTFTCFSSGMLCIFRQNNVRKYVEQTFSEHPRWLKPYGKCIHCISLSLVDSCRNNPCVLLDGYEGMATPVDVEFGMSFWRFWPSFTLVAHLSEMPTFDGTLGENSILHELFHEPASLKHAPFPFDSAWFAR